MQRWGYPTSIRFGPGAIDELAEATRAAGIERPLLVTDPGLVDLPPVTAARAALDAGGTEHEVFCELRPNPVGSDVDRGVAAFLAGGHDGVVAVGGGSALDAVRQARAQPGDRGTFS